ncbi:hypothetical protein Vspart_02883 [Vibrio spartinae]|uniref:PAAR motif protein n=1 Tax=Vibrio spartinae TaxID=1918945 RepID=A0ABX6R244_9VIBR|nr:hypothetical protein Vspart_02883 [Vibrio spartinae]
MPAAARLGDNGSGHGCFPATPIMAGSGDVSINGKPAARVGDAIDCGGSVAAGSGNVLIGDTPYKSPTHKCGEGAAMEQSPFLRIQPLAEAPPFDWASLPFVEEVYERSAKDKQKVVEEKNSDVSGKINSQHLELVTRHPNTHSIARHGGSVTDEQLMHRALTGVAPDGHVKVVKGKTILPPMSSAFHSDELLVRADQAVRNNGALQAIIAQNPNKSILTLTPKDVGDLGVDLGRGFERIAGSKFNPELQGATNMVENLRSVQATYEFNQVKQVWETITIFPSR